MGFIRVDEKTNKCSEFTCKSDYFEDSNDRNYGPAISASMIGAEGDFFHLQSEGALSYIDANKKRKWTWKSRKRGFFPSSPLVDGNKNVYFLGQYKNDSTLFCVDGNTGKGVWSCPLTSTNVDEQVALLLPNIMLNHLTQYLVAISKDFHIYFLDTKSVLEERKLRDHNKFWDYYLKPSRKRERCKSAIMRRDGKIYACSSDTIHCINPYVYRPQGKRTRAIGRWESDWTLKLKVAILSDPVLDEEGNLYFISSDYTLNGVTSKGKPIGTYDLTRIHTHIQSETAQNHNSPFSPLTMDKNGNIHFLSHRNFFYQVNKSELRNGS